MDVRRALRTPTLLLTGLLFLGACAAPRTPTAAPAATTAGASTTSPTAGSAGIGHSSGIDALAWSPDGKLMASAGWPDETVRLWGPDGALRASLPGHGDGAYRIAWSPDGRTLATGDMQGKVRLWQPDGTLIRTIDAHASTVNVLSWSPGGQTFVTADKKDYKLQMWSLEGNRITPFDATVGYEKAVAWSPDGKTLAVATLGTPALSGAILFLDPSGTARASIKGLVSPTPVRTGPTPTRQPGAAQPTVTPTGQVNALAWSPDGRTLAGTVDDRTVRLWQADGAPLRTLTGLRASADSLAWSPDGQTLAATNFAEMRLWKLDGTAIRTLDNHVGRATTWSPDGQILATGNFSQLSRSVGLWKPDGTSIRTLTGFSSSVQAIAWSPDGNILVVGDFSGELRFWSRDGKALVTIPAAPKPTVAPNPATPTTR